MNIGIHEEPNMPTTIPSSQASRPARVVHNAPAVLPQTGFLREARLLQFLPFSHSTLWRRVRAKTFPTPVKISGRITAWRAEDIRAWIEEQGGDGAADG